MKIATWNVNSIRMRIGHATQWLAMADIDVLLIQETKCVDEKFPLADFQDNGYPHCAIYGQPSYNGVAIVSRLPLQDVVCGMPQRPDLTEARVIAATVADTDTDTDTRVVCAYVPNGQSVGSEKYAYKMDWLSSFSDYLKTLADGKTVVGGDYNIAPSDADVYDAADWGEGILTSPQEREAFNALLDSGYVDSYGLFERETHDFSWWDYRAAAFRRNRGLRIDMLLVSQSATTECVSCEVDRNPRSWEKASDHTPVVLDLK